LVKKENAVDIVHKNEMTSCIK